MAVGGKKRGMGFVAGALAGAALSALAVAALSLGALGTAPGGTAGPSAPAAPVAAPAAPPQPAAAAPTLQPDWRRHAASFDAALARSPLVAVVVTGLEADPALADRALALAAPLAVAVDPAAPGALALAQRARAVGFEALALDAAPPGPFVGVALRAPAMPAAAAPLGRMALDLRPSLAALDYAGGPVARAAFALDAAASAERVFQTLQEAARRADGEPPVVVALSASDASLTGLARWLAVTAATPIPLTAVTPRD